MTIKAKGENKWLILFGALCASMGYGMKKLWNKKSDQVFNIITFFALTLGASYNLRIWKTSTLGFKGLLPYFFERLVLTIPWPVHMLLMVIFLGGFILIILGVSDYKIITEFQKKVRLVVKGFDGTYLKVIAVDKKDSFKTKVVIKSVGIGLEKYQLKKDDLESSFAQEIDSIEKGANPQIIILNLTKRKLPTLVSQSDLNYALTRPNSFIVGESAMGPVTKTLDSLPHMLIAGTTGGGKSVFFKQMLLSLLKTTPHIQFYLLDLKRGVEMKDFAILPNVRIAKTEGEAVDVLTKVKKEMDERFKYLEKNGFKEIVPSRDKMDKIVVGIDEASVIYTRSKGDTTKNNFVNTARELTDELAKLARATGIHLILATQKVSKETIDTKVQENIGARVCFKTNTLVNSMIVLGNKMAYELPTIKGRAIWNAGNDYLEIQAPYISDELLKEEIEAIEKDFDDKKKTFIGPMIEIAYNPEDQEDIIQHKE